MKTVFSVLLDIDGTLIDSNDAHAKSWQEYLAGKGIHLPTSQIGMLIGMGGDKILRKVTRESLSESQIEKMSAERDGLYLKKYLSHAKQIPGVRDFVAAMTSRGLRVILATSSGQELVDAFLKREPIQSYLTGIISADHVKASKPSPDIYNRAIRQYGLEAARTVVIGDTPYDIEAAKQVPCPVIAVRTGGFPYTMLSGADEQYDDIQQLTRKMDRSILAK